MSQASDSEIPKNVATALSRLLDHLRVVRDIPAPNEPLPGFELRSRSYYDAWDARLVAATAQSLASDLFEFIGQQVTPTLGADPGHEHLNLHYKITRLRELARGVLTEAHAANLLSSFPVLIDAEAIAPQISEIRNVLGALKEKVDALAASETTFSDGISVGIGPVSVSLSALNEAIASATRSIETGIQYNALALSATLTRMGALTGELIEGVNSLSSTVKIRVSTLLQEIARLAIWLAKKGVELFDEVVSPQTSSQLDASAIIRSVPKVTATAARGGNVGISFGTSCVSITVTGRGIVLHEPNIALRQIHGGGKSFAAVGHDAAKLMGRTPREFEIVRPVQRGIIVDQKSAETIGKLFLAKVYRSGFVNPTMLVAVPSTAHTVERRALQEFCHAMGGRKVFLIEKPLAAAIGANLNVSRPDGSLIVHFGGGITETALVSLGSIVVHRSIRVGGDDLNAAITDYLRRMMGLEIGPLTAERIKLDLAVAVASKNEDRYSIVRGTVGRVGREIMVRADDVFEAIRPTLETIMLSITDMMEHIPPELSGDIVDNGIVLTGGGALLPGMDRLMRDHTGLKTTVATDPMGCVARGIDIVLSAFPEHKRLTSSMS